MSFFENITLRSRRRSESAIETFDDCSSNDSTIEGATNNSVPNIMNDDNEEMEDLKHQISELNSQLLAAHEEINNLSIENSELKETIEAMNIKHKLVEKATKKLASEIGTPNKRTRLSTPLRETLHKQHREKTSSYGTEELITSTQVTLQDQKVQSTKKMTNRTTQEQKSKLCIISSNQINKILPIAENTFPCHQICHYLLPNRGISNLLCNIQNKLTEYTEIDNCIIFIGEDDFRQTNNYFDIIMTIRETLLAITHTNVILCLPTYKYDYYSTMYNFRVEMFNNLLYQDVQSYNYATLFDSNLNLSCDYTMFQKKSGRISNHGITNVFNDLKSYVYTNCDANTVKSQNETSSFIDPLICDSPNSYRSCTTDIDQHFFRL